MGGIHIYTQLYRGRHLLPRRRRRRLLHPLLHRRRDFLGVAVQRLHFERRILRPGVFRLIGARVEITWVPSAFQLWVRGSQRAPPHLGVALQVAFERQTLKPVILLDRL
jgi:hypothetical protein